MQTELVANRFKQGMLMLFCFAFAGFIGLTLAANGMVGVALVLLAIVPVTWIIVGARIWWLPLPFALAFGGVFQFGVKIYPHELAMLAAVVALAPVLPIAWQSMLRHRGAFAIPLLLLCGYLLIHFAGSLIYNKLNDLGGLGNVTRSYTAALWPIAFILMFHLFGKTDQLRSALVLMYVASLIRLVLGVVVHFTDAYLYIPVINYIFAPTSSNTDYAVADLRYSGLAVSGLALAFFVLNSRSPWKFLHLLLFFVGTLAIPLGGSRGIWAFWFFYPLVFLLIYRQIAVTALFFGAILVGVSILNVFPALLDPLPESIQRSLSIAIISERSVTLGQEMAEGSDDFHKRYDEEGYNRWTSSPFTILFGTGIRPAGGNANDSMYDNGDYGLWLERMVDMAANTGAYETGLWTVLAVTGLTGAILYTATFLSLIGIVWRDLWKHKIDTPGRAFAYIGIATTSVWFILCWRGGGFPSSELFYLYLAYAAYIDMKKEANPVTPRQPLPPARLPRAPRFAPAPIPPRLRSPA